MQSSGRPASRFDPESEGPPGLGLEAATGEDATAAGLHPFAQPGQKARLADAGFARQQDQPVPLAVRQGRVREPLLEDGPLFQPPHQRPDHGRRRRPETGTGAGAAAASGELRAWPRRAAGAATCGPARPAARAPPPPPPRAPAGSGRSARAPRGCGPASPASGSASRAPRRRADRPAVQARAWITASAGWSASRTTRVRSTRTRRLRAASRSAAHQALKRKQSSRSRPARNPPRSSVAAARRRLCRRLLQIAAQKLTRDVPVDPDAILAKADLVLDRLDARAIRSQRVPQPAQAPAQRAPGVVRALPEQLADRPSALGPPRRDQVREQGARLAAERGGQRHGRRDPAGACDLQISEEADLEIPLPCVRHVPALYHAVSHAHAHGPPTTSGRQGGQQ